MTEPTPTDNAVLMAWLQDRDVACPLCGYNLRRLTSARCPECGEPLRLDVARADPYLRPWVVTAAATLLPAGLGLLWWVLVPTKGFPRGRESLATFPIVYQMATVPIAAAAIFGRRRFQRWNRPAQRWAATVAAVLGIGSIAVLCYGIV